MQSHVLIRTLVVGVTCLLSSVAASAQVGWAADCECTSNLTVTVDLCFTGQGTFSADVDLCVTTGFQLPGPCTPDPPLPQNPPYSNRILFPKKVCWNDGPPTVSPMQVYNALLCAFIGEVCAMTPNQWNIVVPNVPGNILLTWKFPTCVVTDGGGCLTVCEQDPCGAHNIGVNMSKANGVCSVSYPATCGTHYPCEGACETYEEWGVPDPADCPCM